MAWILLTEIGWQDGVDYKKHSDWFAAWKSQSNFEIKSMADIPYYKDLITLKSLYKDVETDKAMLDNLFMQFGTDELYKLSDYNMIANVLKSVNIKKEIQAGIILKIEKFIEEKLVLTKEYISLQNTYYGLFLLKSINQSFNIEKANRLLDNY